MKIKEKDLVLLRLPNNLSIDKKQTHYNMKNCKNFKIYKFDTGMRDRIKNVKNLSLQFQRSKELTNFKEKMINELSGSNFDEISEKHCMLSVYYNKHRKIQEPYKKNWLFSVFDIGIDIVMEKQNIQYETHWEENRLHKTGF